MDLSKFGMVSVVAPAISTVRIATVLAEPVYWNGVDAKMKVQYKTDSCSNLHENMGLGKYC